MKLKMRITERDVEILRFINECGFCITPHLERRFGIKNWRVYQLMKRLVEAGFVYQIRPFNGQPNLYYLTKAGAEFTDLPALDKINVAIYEHQTTLTNVILTLRERYPHSTWISERRLKHDNFFAGIGVRGHVADGLLQLDEKNQIALEVELTLKSKHRLERILKSYAIQMALKEVWYFCAPSVITTLTNLIVKKPYIKIYPLKEFLS